MSDHHEIELPEPSYWPIVLAFSLLLISIGILSTLIVSAVGVVLLLVSFLGWSLENRLAERKAEEHHG